MMRRIAALGALCVGLIAAAPSGAVTVNVTGGPGLDQGALCATGQSCPTTPTYSLVGSDPVTGAFVYNSVADTVSFTLTLTANANFGGESLLAGSSFSASGVSVLSTSLGGGAIEVFQTGSATGVANVTFNPGLPVIQDIPTISGLVCTIGTGSDQCGVSFGAAGFEVGPSSGTDYNAFLTFNANVAPAPVPLPAAAWLMLSGLGCFARLGVRRRG